MKKVLLVVAIILLTIVLYAGCGKLVYNFVVYRLVGVPAEYTRDWQTVTVDGIGTFRVPEEWNVEQEDDVIYITDKLREDESHIIYIVGTVRKWEDRGVKERLQPHELFDGVEKGDTVSVRRDNVGGIVNISSAHLGLYEYIVDGITVECYLITFIEHSMGDPIQSNLLELLAWNGDVVDYEMATQIARTIIPERDIQRRS